MIYQALSLMEHSPAVQDYLPTAMVKNLSLDNLTDAVKFLHKPPIGAPLSWTSSGVNPWPEALSI